MDWFLYDNGLRHESVKQLQNLIVLKEATITKWIESNAWNAAVESLYPFHDGGRYHIETRPWFLYDNVLCHERVSSN